MDIDLNKIISDLEDFFEINVPDYKIEIASSREEFNRLTNRKESENWEAGWANGYRIVAIHPDKLEEYTDGIHKSDSHPKRIKHELAHLFYVKLTDGEFKPAWLNEGLAFYLDGRGGTEPKASKDRYAALKYFKNFDGHVYKPSSFIVKTLLDRFGKAKLIELIKSIRPGITEDRFQELFQKVYDFAFTEESLRNII